MKKIFSLFVAMLFSVVMFAAQGGTLTATPAAPIDPSTDVVLTYDGAGTNFASWEPKCFIHAWLVAAEGETLSKTYSTEWVACQGDEQYAAIADNRKMTYAGETGQHDGKYTITINIKSFFDVEDDDLEKIGQLGVIVCTQWVGGNAENDNKTNSFFLDVNEEIIISDVTAYFVNDDDWTVVQAYVFIDADPWPSYKAWPGEAMTKTGEQVNGKDIYSYTFPENYTTIIFNSKVEEEGVQTVNLTFDVAKPYYSRAQGQWYATKGDIPAVVIPAKFYICGTAVGNWDSNAVKSTEDSYTIEGLAADTEYQLKITVDGTWDTEKGYTDLTVKPAGVTEGATNNIVFTLKTAGDVTVTYKEDPVTFTVEGDFKDTTTAIDEVEGAVKTVKRVVNGQLVIERDGKFFNALGTQVK